jgi:predicted metal-dependent hydrolase
MAQKTVFLPEVGEVILSKRKGTSHMRLSVNAAGKIRVGMPYWTPYQAGIAFAKSKSPWIKSHIAAQSTQKLRHGDLVGKAHRVKYIYTDRVQSINTRVSFSEVIISTGLSISDMRVQEKLVAACERALKNEAEKLLVQRLNQLSAQYGFEFHSVVVRKLTARWGSCSSRKIITLSYYLMQLPWHLIDYVLIHELIHTRHLHHGKDFWEDFIKILPNAKQFQKEIRPYKPLVRAYQTLPVK